MTDIPLFRSREQTFLTLTALIFLIWWFGIAGSEFFWAPTLIWFIYTVYLITKGYFEHTVGNSVENSLSWSTGKGYKPVLIFLSLNCLLWFLYIIIKYYSFSYHTYDSGIYHNIVYNLSNGEFFSSFHNINFLANHFNFNLVFISPLYKILPHAHWIMGLKVLAYLACVYFIWKLCEENLSQTTYKRWAVILSILWLFLYTPIISSIRYEFQGSCLSIPFIFYAFLSLQRENWWRFGITLLLIVGFKEHLASVWIGFGCYLVFATPRKKLGGFLILMGILFIYLIMEQAMPWLREYKETWRPGVDPFKDLGPKARYCFRLLLPLGFLPLIYWRKGIMAGPPIGINLISSSPTMYSSHYHYDDVASCMLFIATILSLRYLPFKSLWQQYGKKRWVQITLVFSFLFLLHFMPKSNLRFIRETIPEKKHFELLQEVRNIDQQFRDKRFAVLDVLGIYFNRKEIQVFASKGKSCIEDNLTTIMHIVGEKPRIDYIILAKGVGTYNLSNFDECLTDLRATDQYQEIQGYKHLLVFKNVH